MDRARQTLTKVLGKEAADNFIKSALAAESDAEIKQRVCEILDTRKVENQLVYKILISEKERRSIFPKQGYRKSDTTPSAFGNLISISDPRKPTVQLTKGSAPDSTIPKAKQKVKYVPLFCEGARGEQLVSILPGRHPCQCLATKHQLINNCSACGRIVCAQEGSGQCYFCGNLVCTKQEADLISRGSKSGLKLQNRLMQAQWAKGVPIPPYRSKSRLVSKNTDDLIEDIVDHCEKENETESDDDTPVSLAPMDGAQQRMEAGLAAALANRDRLLEYDATSARRTRVLDDELDYFVTEGSGGMAVWISPEARERVAQRVAELRAQRHASRLQTTKLYMDLADQTVKLMDTRDEAARKLYKPDQQEEDELERAVRLNQSSVIPSAEGLEETVFADRSIDPTLDVHLLKFIPQFTSETLALQEPADISSTSLTLALKQPFSDIRLQDDTSRQVSDEGYCLSLHQPWASLLVRGIKRDEGRTWYTALRGCLWIASTSKKPLPDDVREAEESFVMSGGNRENLPQSYPTGCLLGRVNVVDVLPQDEYRKQFPNGTSESPFVFLCDDPRELILKLPISGKHKIYKLEKHVHMAARKHLA